MPIFPQSANIIRWIGEEKGWSKQNNSRKVKQQLRDELAERNREQYINIQPVDNPKRIVRLSGWSRGKIECKIRQRMRDELAAQQQEQCIMENCLQIFRAGGTKIKNGKKVPSGRQKWNNRDMAVVLNFRIILNSLLAGECPPCFLRNNPSSESAEPESTATPGTVLKPNPKPKRVRKNSSLLLFKRSNELDNIFNHSGQFVTPKLGWVT
ncbi:hypothetical protein BX661DRAFT_224833 [Kickxella alabastrina]|uniref:uncharacterized protein n=1 Tax=Kickxella alabastrina TaxID=61397 RepID=UPI00222108F3|nr:uncharacterized protein BX661DRAFT_224833 [Kickxella alabastrina]KAI7826648.1 hypothetical protein BX661DRAFT_224833 [Kickxella alabastrina]KAJ1946257.1 hypothetical protein GGF37_001269 [Kickxella alabastrina]